MPRFDLDLDRLLAVARVMGSAALRPLAAVLLAEYAEPTHFRYITHESENELIHWADFFTRTGEYYY